MIMLYTWNWLMYVNYTSIFKKKENYLYLQMKVKLLSRVQLFATPSTVAYQAPLSMGFSRQEYWNGLPFPPAGWYDSIFRKT